MPRSRLIVAVAFLGPLLYFLGPTLWSSKTFAFRDAPTFYYPLYRWTGEQWGRGQPPLWNPLENTGHPIAAEASAAAFYPGQILLAAPLPRHLRFNLYVAAHLCLALAGAYLVARRWNASTMAAALGALAYGLGGSVFFQHCNVVFLVGAAWLPWSLGAAEAMLRTRRWRWSLMFGAALAMMVLGGDPQTAYHTGLAVLLMALFRWRAAAADPDDEESEPRDSGRWQALTRIGASILVAFLLASVQILPSAEWARRSPRANYDSPRNLYEWATARPSEDLEASDPTAVAKAGHLAHAYQFSVAPWRWAEWLWPNFSGRLFPTNRRWLNVIPAEGRVWSASLYMGLLPVLLLLGGWRLWGDDPRVRALSLLSLFSALGACGWYGAGWLLHEVHCAGFGGDPARPIVAQPVGGLYWLLVVVLPGYVLFRYPAKWLTLFALSIGWLAALRADNVWARPPRRWLAIVLGLAVFSATAAGVVWLARGPIAGFLEQRVIGETYFGPFDAAAAVHDLFSSFLHTALVAAVIWIILRRGDEHSGSFGRAVGCLLVLAVEITIANHWLAPLVDVEQLDAGSPIAVAIERNDARPIDGVSVVYRGNASLWFPSSFAVNRSKERLQEGVAWSRRSLHPKLHLLERSGGIRLMESQASIASSDFANWLELARGHGPLGPEGLREPAPEALRLMGVEFCVLPRDLDWDPGRLLAEPVVVDDAPENVRLWRIKRPAPRARIVHETTAPAADDMEAIWRSDGDWRDLECCVVLKTVEVAVEPLTAGAAESCRIIREQPCLVELETNLESAGVLVLTDLHAPGWTVEVDQGSGTQSRRLLRANGLMRAVALSAGRQRVVFRYRPTAVRVGAWISALAWLAWLVSLTRVGWTNCLHPRSAARSSSAGAEDS